MSTTTGETTFSTKNEQVQKFKYPEPPAQDWEAQIIGTTVDVREGAETGVPYVNVAFELQNSAATEGGKNLRIYKMFFLGTKPNAQGNVGVKMNDGIMGLARALGTDLDCDIITKTVRTKDPKTKEITGEEAQQFVDPHAVAEWLKSNAGITFKLRSKLPYTKDRNGKKTDEKKAEVAYFIPAEGGSVSFQ
jgi:hypothetical protein